MWNPPTMQDLSHIPGLYQTEHVPAKTKVIHQHFFLGGCDWYATEFDGEDVFFGYVVLNGDYDNAEWGYFSLVELRNVSIHGMRIDRDLHWEPVRFADIPDIGGRYAR